MAKKIVDRSQLRPWPSCRRFAPLRGQWKFIHSVDRLADSGWRFQKSITQRLWSIRLMLLLFLNDTILTHFKALWNMSQLQTNDIAESAMAVMTKGPKPNFSKL